jgi:hypothetical protein
VVAFEVWHNGVKLCTAGIDDDGLILAILTWVEPSAAPESLEMKQEGELEVSGHSESGKRHVEWIKKALKPGDEVLVKVLQVSEVDAPRLQKW